MRISRVEAIPVRIRRDEAYLGELPAAAKAQAYFTRPPYRALYSACFETAFVKITTADGLIGWGEALAPVAPEVVCTIIEQLLTPCCSTRSAGWQRALEYDVRPHARARLLRRLYAGCHKRLRYRFVGPAREALGCARIQIAGWRLPRARPCYVSGLPRPTAQTRAELALAYVEKGFKAFKLAAGHGYHADRESVVALRDALGESRPCCWMPTGFTRWMKRCGSVMRWRT